MFINLKEKFIFVEEIMVTDSKKSRNSFKTDSLKIQNF